MSVTARVRVERGGAADTVGLLMSVVDGEMVGHPVPIPALDGRTLSLRRMSVEERLVELEVGGNRPPAEPEALLVEATLEAVPLDPVGGNDVARSRFADRACAPGRRETRCGA